jgi:hypothetical protein
MTFSFKYLSVGFIAYTLLYVFIICLGYTELSGSRFVQELFFVFLPTFLPIVCVLIAMFGFFFNKPCIWISIGVLLGCVFSILLLLLI